MRRRQFLRSGAVVCAAGLAGCAGDDGDESLPDLRGAADVTLRNDADEQLEARFLLVDPDGVPRMDTRETLAAGENWRARVTGLVPGRYSYTVGAPNVSRTDFWQLNDDCPRLLIDAAIANVDEVSVDGQCTSNEE